MSRRGRKEINNEEKKVKPNDSKSRMKKGKTHGSK